jgi:hypothetical protein
MQLFWLNRVRVQTKSRHFRFAHLQWRWNDCAIMIVIFGTGPFPFEPHLPAEPAAKRTWQIVRTAAQGLAAGDVAGTR